ncbi:MAG: hypothetical protein HZC28_11620 [Spirochaetes bacterium]|nr:hypothetical protein [Spirochaetota bacterium]
MEPIAGQEPGRLRVTIPLNDMRPLHQELYGVNCEMMRRLSYLDSGFQELYRAAEKPIIRYPGGTTANYWNPFTGFMDVIPGHEHRSVEANEAIRKRTGGSGEPYGEFFKFVRDLDVPYSITLNLCTLSVESNRRWLAAVRDAGARPRFFELGNEVHYNEYAGFFADGAAYAVTARRMTDVIRELFPGARVGVVIPNVSYTDEVFLDELRPAAKNNRRYDDWVRQLRQDVFFDAVILHLYSTYGLPPDIKIEIFPPLAQTYRNAMAHQDGRFDVCIDSAAALFPGKDIWLTEYHLGGWTPALRQYPLSDSYLGSLHSAAMLLKAARRSEITMAHRNTFTAMLGGTTAADGITRVRNNNWRHFLLLGEALRGSERVCIPRVAGAERYSGAGKYRGDYAEIETAIFWNGSSGWLVIVNKFEREYRLAPSEFADHAADGICRNGSVLQYSPRGDVPLEQAYGDRFIMTELRMPLCPDELVLPPYSLTRVHISR